MDTKDDALAEFQNAVGFAVDELYRSPMVGAYPLPPVTVKTTRTAVPHLRGERPTGWWPVNLEADARVWQDAPADDRFLYLIASAEVRWQVVVF
jgi:hypothetical protein